MQKIIDSGHISDLCYFETIRIDRKQYQTPIDGYMYQFGIIKKETDKALLINNNWIPKSQVKYLYKPSEDSKECVIYLKQWLWFKLFKTH